MKKTKTFPRNKKLLYGLLIFIVVAAGLVVLSFWLKQGGKAATDNSSPTQGSPTSNPNTKTPDTVPTGTKNDTNADKNTVVPSSAKNVEVLIVDASQYGNTFEIRAYAAAPEDGTCTFTLSKGALVVTKESPATIGPSTSSCQTVDIPVDNFTEKGSWHLVISYKSKSSNYTGSTSKEVVVK